MQINNGGKETARLFLGEDESLCIHGSISVEMNFCPERKSDGFYETRVTSRKIIFIPSFIGDNDVSKLKNFMQESRSVTGRIQGWAKNVWIDSKCDVFFGKYLISAKYGCLPEMELDLCVNLHWKDVPDLQNKLEKVFC